MMRDEDRKKGVGGRRRASDGKASAARPRRNSFGVSATSAELFKRARNGRRRRHFGTLDTAMRDPQAVVHAYRHFYRQGLKAIHYSTPSRHILVKTLRSSFRSSPPDDFNPQRVSNTLRFLQRATDVAGIEHKILKNLMITRYWEQPHTMKNARM